MSQDESPAALPIYQRDPRVVRAVMETLCATPTDVMRWTELIHAVGGRFPLKKAKVIENVVYDLVVFGAISKMGAYERSGDTRVVGLTPLGLAWWNRELLAMVEPPTGPMD